MSASKNEFLARNSSIVQALRTYLVVQPEGVERLLPKEKYSISVSVQPLASNVIEDKENSTPYTNNNEVRLQLLEIFKEERKFLGFLEDLCTLLNNGRIISLFSKDALIFIETLCIDLDSLINTQKEHVKTLNACVENGFNREQWIECINVRNNDAAFRTRVIHFNIDLLFLEKLFAKINKEQLEKAIDKAALDKMAFDCAFSCDSVNNFFKAKVNIRQHEDSINLLESKKLDLSGAEQNEAKDIEEKKESYIKSLAAAKKIMGDNKEAAVQTLKALEIYFGDDSASMDSSYLAFEKKRDVSQGTPDLILRGQISQTGAQYITRKALILKNCEDLFLGDLDTDKKAQLELKAILSNVENDAAQFNQFIGEYEILEELKMDLQDHPKDTFLNVLLNESHVKKIENQLKKSNSFSGLYLT